MPRYKQLVLETDNIIPKMAWKRAQKFLFSHLCNLPYLVSEQGLRKECHATPECECLEAGHSEGSGDRSSTHVCAGSCSGAHTPPEC